MAGSGEIFNTLFERLEKFIRTETIVGEPIQVGSITLVPIMSVSFGIGGGEGSGKDSKGNDGSGGGGGVGCKMTPNAMAVVKNDHLSIYPLTDRGSLEKIIEMVPELITKIEHFSGKKKAEKADTE